MWNDWPFYRRLGNLKVFGKAFIKWFNISHSAHPDEAPRWWYGMAMIGDPALVANGDYFPPAIPQDLVAASGRSSIDLSWQANTEPDLGSYTIYRDVDGIVPEYLASVAAPATSYQDSAVGNDTTYTYWVTAVDTLNNESDYSVPDSCTYSDLAAVAGGWLGPLHRFVRSQPNPFSGNTVISFSLSGDCHVALSIYDVSGRCVRTLIDDNLPPGINTVAWDGKDNQGQPVGMGLYLCRLATDDGSRLTMKMILLR
jgi:hypothetical protein